MRPFPHISRRSFGLGSLATLAGAGSASAAPMVDPRIQAAMAKFKSVFATHDRLWRHGQFYVTQSAANEVITAVTTVLTHPTVLPLRLLLLDYLIATPSARWDGAWLRSTLDTWALNPAVAGRGQVIELKPRFLETSADAQQALQLSNIVWGHPKVEAAAPWMGGLRLGHTKRAYEFEKGGCFVTARAMARKYLSAAGSPRGAATLPLSDGLVGDARVLTVAGIDSIVHGNWPALEATTAQMRSVLDAGGLVLCGVLSGVTHDKSAFPTPEHFLLVFGHGTVNGQPGFVFWDSDVARTAIAALNWDRSFGLLASAPGRLSTALDLADMGVVDADGNHVQDPIRHRYLVYTVQKLTS